MYYQKPPASYSLRLPLKKGMRIGLFGGSFNPPHQGHVDVAKTALKKLRLDRVLWLVSPQNPLKSEKPLSSDKRIQLINALTQHPQFIPTNFEEKFDLNFTFQTIRFLKKRYPHVTFYFITGSDNIKTMPKWHEWRTMFDLCHWAVIARPNNGFNLRVLKAFRTPSDCNKYYLNHRLNTLSSTALRNNQKKS